MGHIFRDVFRRSLSFSQLSPLPKPASASEIRKTFIDYFCQYHNHLHIRSSPVFSLKDPTLAFTNAGMNQFKEVFLDLVEPASSRVANSQKCIRIGGVHNDLDEVGQDGIHHTFFEMLGNWSFGDYFKEEACRMSWDLFTAVYNIPPERLYVTYFGGDEALGLGPDVEVREIWRQIGVKESHILAFGTKHNFWSGSLTGPCGPCTEIHYDQIPGRTDAGSLVNLGTNEVTELWNLVFTEFDKKATGELVPLKKHFVDTGMGLERLVAVLQKKASNYDTDLFLPLFETIREHTGHSGYTGEYGGNAVDHGYRLLVDYSRMLTVALSDGMLPNHQNKVRGIFRKSLTIAQKIFTAEHDLLKELSSRVAEILSDSYPEIGRNLSKTHYIIDSEAEIIKTMKENSVAKWQKFSKIYPGLSFVNITECPQLLMGLDYLQTNVLNAKKSNLTGKDFFILFDTYGIPVHVTEQVASQLGVGFDRNAFLQYQGSIKMAEKDLLHKKFTKLRKELSYVDVLQKLKEKKIRPTLDYFKYYYRRNKTGEYVFKDQETTIEAILREGELLDEISAEEIEGEQEIGLILDRTQLYSEEGGQASDWGTLTIEKEIIFDIRKVVKVKHFVIHFGTFRNLPRGVKVSVQNIGVLQLDKRRVDVMRNHTALHLVNAFLRDKDHTIGEKYSVVTPEKLVLEFMVYKMNLHLTEDMKELEKFVKDFITHGVSVKRRILSHPQFQAMDDVVFIPGESIVSREIPVIEINSGFKLSREYCTGTHLLNASDMKDFVVKKFTKGTNRVQRIEAVTGEKCSLIRKADAEVQEEWSTLKREVERERTNFSEFQDLRAKLRGLFSKVSCSEELSHITKMVVGWEITEAKKNLTQSEKTFISNFLKGEVLKASEESSTTFVVRCLDCPWNFTPDYLEIALEGLCQKPILMIFKYGDMVAIQCVVPKEFVSDAFSAKDWLANSEISLGGVGKCKAHQSPKFFYYMENRKATQADLELIMEAAIGFAEEKLQNRRPV